MKVTPNWTGVAVLATLAMLAGVCAWLGETEMARLLVAAIIGVALPQPHQIVVNGGKP